MRRNTVVAAMCVAAVLAVIAPQVQTAAAADGRAGSGASAGHNPARSAAFPPSHTGVITGVVLGASGRPLAGACVAATLEAGTAAGPGEAGRTSSLTTRTSAGGRYVFGGLTAGRYSLRYRSCTRPAGPRGATSYALVSGGQIVRIAPVALREPRLPGSRPATRGPAIPANAGITAPAGRRLTISELRRRGTQSGNGGISGRVTNAAGRPIKGLCVEVQILHGGVIIGVDTSARGTYSFGKYLPAGKYTVEFGYCGPSQPTGNWAPQWYRGKYTQAGADLVTVRAGKISRGIDAVMRRGGAISGVVRGKGGARLSGVCVSAVTPDGKQFVAQAKTVRGRYRIGALDPGRYRVYFDPACGYHATPYLGQWWPGASALKASKPVRVRLSAVTGHVNAALRVGGTITGTVRFKNSRGKRLAGICVFGSGLGAVSSVQPDAATKKNGTFVMEGLPAGRYQLSFGAAGCGSKGNYLYYNDPHPVRVGLGQAARVVVFLQPGAIISGTVTSAATGLPLAGICVFINDNGGDGVATSADGTFRLDQIQPGRYSVSFSGGCGNKGSYAPQWFPGQSEQFHAIRVTFRAGRLTSGINAAMRPGSGISGTVTSQAGVPLGGICIGAYTPNEAGYLFGVYGDFYNGNTKHGAYQISNLAAGQYELVFFSCGSGPGWGSQWYRAATRLSGAGLLDVPAGTMVTGVDAALARGGAISGTVRGLAHQQYSFNCIIATNLASGASESTEADSFPSGLTVRYAIGGLDPGRYRVEFYDCGGGGAATQWYSGQSSPGRANPVTVRAARVSRRIDAVLARPASSAGSISGQVTSRATGKPLAGICVTASSSTAYQFGRSGARGRYTITHLASGSYQLYFGSCRGDRYAFQARQGKVRVHAPGAVRGVNFAVSLAGAISGAVAGGSPASASRPGICVTAEPMAASGQPGYAVTGQGGTYTITGLVPGRYQLYFDPIGCVYGSLPFAPQWYSGQVSRSTATPVTVKAGSGTSGINVTLARDGTIAGTVTGPAPASSPLTGICVKATPAAALARAGKPVYTVSQSGSYTLTGLPPGEYFVSFRSGCGASGYPVQWWQDAKSRATATPVTTAPGAVTNGIDVTMHG